MTGTPLQQHPSTAYHALSQQLAVQQQLSAAQQQLSNQLGQVGTPAAASQPQAAPQVEAQVSLKTSVQQTTQPTSSSSAGSQPSPSAKKFRPAYARPSNKSQRYIPKPIPQELGNLKVYSKSLLELI